MFPMGEVYRPARFPIECEAHARVWCPSMEVGLFLGSQTHLAEQTDVPNFTDPSLPPTATLMPWMVCTV